jgi:hypothetical protein
MRKHIAHLTISCIFSLMAVSIHVQAATQDVEFHDRIVQTYGFDPRSNKVEEVAAKAHAMDAFWTYATANKEKVLPLLRGELASGTHPSFFSYDGAKLLMTLSPTQADLQLAANSIAQVKVSDIEHNDYFQTVHQLALKGVDVTPAAMKVLDDQKFWIRVGSGARSLPQAYSLAFLLFTMPEKNFLKPLIERLRTEALPESQMSILFSLWSTGTPEGKAAIAQFLQDESKPKEARAFAATLGKPGEAGIGAYFLPSVDRLKEQRRLALANIDGKTVQQFSKYTAEILMKQ